VTGIQKGPTRSRLGQSLSTLIGLQISVWITHEEQSGLTELLPLSPDQAWHSQAVEVSALERTPESGAALANLSRVLRLGCLHRSQQLILAVAGKRLLKQPGPNLL
jgi:hypothetical protein